MALVNGTSAGERTDAADGVTSGSDFIFGFEGDDVIKGLGGNDDIMGGRARTPSTAAGHRHRQLRRFVEGDVIGLGRLGSRRDRRRRPPHQDREPQGFRVRR
jgi:hypothetical protein